MINLKNNTLQPPGRDPEPIERWGVVFCTMEGTHETLEEAIEACERNFQPPQTIMPLPVAFGPTAFEVCLKQTMMIDDSGIGEIP